MAASSSGEQLQELLKGALSDPALVEDRKGVMQVFAESWDSLGVPLKLRRLQAYLRGVPERIAARVVEAGLRVDERVYQWQQGRLRGRVEQELIRMAVEAGDLPPKALPTRFRKGDVTEHELEQLRFPDKDVVEAFYRVRPPPRKPFVERALDGELPLRRALGVVISMAILVVLVLLFIYLGLAAAIFAAQDVSSDATSGGIVDSATGLAAVGAAASVGLKPLWEYPSLSLDELRKVEDVLFVHNQATHVLRVASIRRTAGGSVLLKAADSSSIRVEPSGRSYWWRTGQQEVFLQSMEAWRLAPRDAEVDWLTSGLLASQVVVPM